LEAFILMHELLCLLLLAASVLGINHRAAVWADKDQ